MKTPSPATILMCALIALAAPAAWSAPDPADAAAAAPADYAKDEAALFTEAVQVTSRSMFIKAGEAYFNADATWIIFQAVPIPGPGAEPQAFYSMYVAKLKREGDGRDGAGDGAEGAATAPGRVTGIEAPIRISPPGSANTCGWFHPTEPWHVLFGSTLTPPAEKQKAGFQVGTRKYVWMFPDEMDIVTRTVPEIAEDAMPGCPMNAGIRAEADASKPAVLFSRAHYDAECSYSADGRFVLYAHVREPKDEHDRPDADIWVYDTRTGAHHALVEADGYDGGPFFSPDGRAICYRSDRRGDDLLQLFVARLRFDAEGVPVGIEGEHQLTDDSNVNWAPYWHPGGKFLVYGSSAVGHTNYEVFAAGVDPDRPARDTRTRRVTFAPGADVLPVFSNDGKLMMWTSQRGEKVEGEQKPSSQVWIARWTGGEDPTAPR